MLLTRVFLNILSFQKQLIYLCWYKQQQIFIEISLQHFDVVETQMVIMTSTLMHIIRVPQYINRLIHADLGLSYNGHFIRYASLVLGRTPHFPPEVLELQTVML